MAKPRPRKPRRHLAKPAQVGETLVTSCDEHRPSRIGRHPPPKVVALPPQAKPVPTPPPELPSAQAFGNVWGGNGKKLDDQPSWGN